MGIGYLECLGYSRVPSHKNKIIDIQALIRIELSLDASMCGSTYMGKAYRISIFI